MQKRQNTFFHRHGIGKLKDIDVAPLWLQDDVKSNRLRVRWVKSKDNLADIGTKVISNKIIRKHAITMGYIDAQESLKTGGVMVLWIEQIRAVQLSRKRHWSQLLAMLDSSSSSGSVGSQISLRVTKRETTPNRTSRHLVVRFHTSRLSRSVSVLHTLVSRRNGMWSARSSW